MPCHGSEVKDFALVAMNSNASDYTGASMILTYDGRVFVAGYYLGHTFGAGYSTNEGSSSDHWKQVKF